MIEKNSTKKILEKNKARTVPKEFSDTVILLHNIRSMHNVGSVFRTCDAFGIHELLLSGFTPCPPRPEISKSALGADKNVKWKYFDTTKKLINYLSEQDYLIIGIEQTNESKNIETIEPTSKKMCFVFGNEVTGISDDLLPHLSQCYEIPQFGNKHSLNVSVSAGIVIFHYLSRFL